MSSTTQLQRLETLEQQYLHYKGIAYEDGVAAGDEQAMLVRIEGLIERIRRELRNDADDQLSNAAASVESGAGQENQQHEEVSEEAPLGDGRRESPHPELGPPDGDEHEHGEISSPPKDSHAAPPDPIDRPFNSNEEAVRNEATSSAAEGTTPTETVEPTDTVKPHLSASIPPTSPREQAQSELDRIENKLLRRAQELGITL